MKIAEAENVMLTVSKCVDQMFRLTGERREVIADVLRGVAKDGIKRRGSLDTALAQIETAYRETKND